MTRWRIIASFVLVSLIWGSTWLVIKDQISAGPPGWMVTWRFSVAALGMFALTAWRGESLTLAPGGGWLAVMVGLTQFCGNFQFVYRAEHYIASGLVAVLYALMMVPNAGFARVMMGVRAGGRFWIGSAVAIGGIGVLMAREWHGTDGADGTMALGIGLTLTGMVCASAANVMQATAAGRRQPLFALLAWSMLVGACVDGALAYAMYGAPVLTASPRYWAGVGWLALAGSVVTFPVYFGLIRAIGAGRAAYVNVVVPVVAMGLSTVFEGYRWTGGAALGAGVAMVGLFIALTGRAKVSDPG